MSNTVSEFLSDFKHKVKSEFLRVNNQQMAAKSSNFMSPCISKFDGDYEHWNMLIENILRTKDYWSVIETWFVEPALGEILNNTQRKALE